MPTGECRCRIDNPAAPIRSEIYSLTKHWNASTRARRLSRKMWITNQSKKENERQVGTLSNFQCLLYRQPAESIQMP